MIKRFTTILTTGLALAALCVVSTDVQAQNQLSNTSFELPIASGDSTTTFGGFTGFGTEPVLGTTDPLSGLQHLILEIPSIDNTFIGTQQTVPNIIAGSSYTLEINARSDSPLGIGAEFRIEYLDAGGAFVGGQFDNNVDITTALTDSYAPFSQTSTAPVGATQARAVIALQSFGGGDNSGIVFLDDVTLSGPVTVPVPEPSTLGLMAAGLIGLVSRRRRS